MRLRPLLTMLMAVAALSLVAAGCGDDDEDTTTTPTTTGATGATGAEGGGGGGATSVGMTEFEFDPSDLTVSEGDTVSVSNDGQIPHNFTVEGEDVATSDLDAGDSEDVTVDLAPGTYDFECTIADHAEQGMTGTLKVE